MASPVITGLFSVGVNAVIELTRATETANPDNAPAKRMHAVAVTTHGRKDLTRISGRFTNPWALVPAALILPFYKELFRMVRIRALVLELLRVKYEDSYIPRASYAHAPRF